MNPYLQLFFASLFPTVLAVIFFLLDKYTPFSKLKPWVKQLIYGVCFGCLAIVGTEWGPTINEANLNCRDAAVLTAGLLFGGPAGVIAGFIGGIERWLSCYWGGPTFTRLACSLATILAGFYAWGVRRFMLENHKPDPFFAFCSAVVMEVFHMALFFLTNTSEPTKAMAVVRSCTIPMVSANGFAVGVACLALLLLSREKLFVKRKDRPISKVVQQWLLLSVVCAFALTSTFVYRYQTSLANQNTEQLLRLTITDTKSDIKDESDSSLLTVTYAVGESLKNDGSLEHLKSIAENYNLAEINLVDSNGIIYESNVESYLGYNMASGTQSSEFLCLLLESEYYVQEYGPTSFDPSVYRKYAGVKFGTGFIQIGIDAAAFQANIDTQVKDITKNRHVGNTGFILIIDSSYNIVSAPSSFEGITKVDPSTTVGTPDTMFTVEMFDASYYGEYTKTEGYYIVSFLPEEEAMQARNIAIYLNAFMEVILFAILFAIIYALIKLMIIKQLDKVNNSLANISNGNLNEVVNARKSREFSLLSDDINATVDTLKQYIDEASKRIDKELEFAKQIQTSVLPAPSEAIKKRKEFDIFATMETAKEVGGDFYDFYLNEKNVINLLVADVSGKGIPAAMFMMRAKAELKSLTEAEYSLDQVFTEGNRALCEGNGTGMFVTVWQGSVDLTTGLVQFVNAGHNPPLLKKASSGKFEYFKSKTGFVLAGLDGFNYKVQQLQLEPGDVLFLYTDGVTEAVNPKMELYGEQRLLDLLNSCSYQNMEELCAVVRKDIDVFASGASQADDITMLAFNFFGVAPTPSIHFEETKAEDITAMTEFLDNELDKIDCPMKVRYQLDIALDEIVSNIIHHGYSGKPGPVTMFVDYREERDTVYLKFVDKGIPYNPLHNADPNVTLSAEERQIGGLGIYMVKKSMDDMRYRYENGENSLTLTKKLKEDNK